MLRALGHPFAACYGGGSRRLAIHPYILPDLFGRGLPRGQLMKDRSFSRFAWLTLGYTTLVVLWGAFVRATGSGAGCGEHWPLCNGTVLQREPAFETLVELSHRATSGLTLLFVGVLMVLAYRRYPKGHAARHGATLSLIFLLIEAGLGAGLVLLSLVAQNSSVMRAVAVALHLVNTFILLSCITYTAWYATLGRSQRFQRRAGPLRSLAVLGGLAGFLLVGASGAIVALGDTLFPATTLAEGWQQHLSPAAHFLIRLRVAHPLLAIATSVGLVLLGNYLRRHDQRPRTHQLSYTLSFLVVGQVLLGTLNMVLLAPIWLQMVHLLVADATWVTLVCLALEALTRADQPHALAPTATVRQDHQLASEA